MAATLIFGLLCVAGVIFMIGFLVALSGDGRANSPCRVIYLTPGHMEAQSDPSRFATAAGTAVTSDTNSRLRFKVIAGKGERSFRRVG